MEDDTTHFVYPDDPLSEYERGRRDGFLSGLRFCIDWILYGRLRGSGTRAMVLYQYGYTVLWDSKDAGTVKIRGIKRKLLYTARLQFKVFIVQWSRDNPDYKLIDK